MPEGFQKNGRRAHYLAAQGLIQVAAHLFLGYDTSGMDQIPREGPFLLAANHKSYLDPMLVGACLDRGLRYFAKRQLFRHSMIDRILRGVGAIPVDREGADRRALAVALEILAAGEGLLVFPEGTRIRRPGLGPAKPGIGLLAARSGAPVIPVWIGNSWAPERTWWRRVPVRLRFGRPMCFAAIGGAGEHRQVYEDATTQIMAAIAALAGEGVKIPR